MKKALLLTLLFALTFPFSQAFSQDSKFSLGIESGSNWAILYGNPILKQGRQINIRTYRGFSFQYNLNRHFSLRSGLAYENKGHKREFPVTDNSGQPAGYATATLKFDYLTAPLLLRFNLGNRVKYFINAGPFVGYALRQKVLFALPTGEEITESYKENSYQLDYGIAAGAGIAISLIPEIDFSLEIRDNLGLYNTSRLPVVEDGSVKTNNLNFLIGFAYNFGASQKEAIE